MSESPGVHPDMSARHRAMSLSTAHTPREFAGPGIVMRASAPTGLLDLRGDGHDNRFAEHVGRVTGLELPCQPNGFVRSASGIAFWLGPDQWLLHMSDACMPALETGLLENREVLLSANDVSSGFVEFTISGANAAIILRSGTSYDLERLSDGVCAQTVLARTSALFWKSDPDAYCLMVRRSFAAYLWRWLVDAALLWGDRADA